MEQEKERPAAQTIMVIDDTPANLKLLQEILRGLGYKPALYTSGATAMEALEAVAPALILLDITMPDMSGFEVCQKIKSHPFSQHIPVIFISALGEMDSKVRAFEVGGVDYIIKPFEVDEIRIRIGNHLRIAALQNQVESMNAQLEERVRQQVEEIVATNGRLLVTRQAIITALAQLSELRDNDTGDHLYRVCRYCEAIASRLAQNNAYAKQVDEAFVANLSCVSALHDIGKVGIEDKILLKPSKLTAEEYAVMQQHTTIGAKTMERLRQKLGDDPFIVMGHEVVLYHHECWDGSGYPYGLKGGQIPLSAQIMAIADVYDALISKRPYKPPFVPEQARQIIGEGAGKAFAPDVVVAFEAVFPSISS